MSEKEFDLDFDFEKEYGVELPKEDDNLQIDDDFDLDAILAEEFGGDAAAFDGEYTADFDYGPEVVPEPEPEAEPETRVIPESVTLEDMLLEDEPAEEYPEPEVEEPQLIPVLVDKAKAAAAAVGALVGGLVSKLTASDKGSFSKEDADASRSEPSADGRRRRVSPMRKFKNETLPLVILGITAVLILIFVFGSASRAITNARLNKEAEKLASESAESAAQKEAAEVKALLEEAKVMAAGYDYEGAVDLLNTFSGSTSKYPEIDQAKADYTMAISQLVPYEDVKSITNLSFHVLIADPARAYKDANYASSYQKNFVTTDEFRSILQELYDNGYILVDMDDIVTETTTEGVTSYDYATLNLPEGKTPIMLTETLVNYFTYMVDSDGNGEADKGGAGFAFRLVVDSKGDIKTEYIDAEGNTQVGSYDLVPILEDFIAEHPDFSYHGARATLAVCGYDGIFGYRINSEVIEAKGQEYYDEQVAGAKEVVNALRDQGYTIACNTYRNKNYGDISADQIQADLDSWKKDIVPVVGEVDTLVYAQGSDISTTGDYSGSKYTVLHNEGFKYFISAGTKATTEATEEYVRQVRLMVTGTQMVNAASVYASFFDAASVLDTARG